MNNLIKKSNRHYYEQSKIKHGLCIFNTCLNKIIDDYKICAEHRSNLAKKYSENKKYYISKQLSHQKNKKNLGLCIQGNCQNVPRINVKTSQFFVYCDAHQLEQKNRSKKYKRANKQKIALSALERKKKLRSKFFEMYGNTCVCCGEKNERFLTLDHKLNNGKSERNKDYLRATNNLNLSEYQTLCFNCNIGRYINGGICPHKKD